MIPARPWSPLSGVEADRLERMRLSREAQALETRSRSSVPLGCCRRCFLPLGPGHLCPTVVSLDGGWVFPGVLSCPRCFSERVFLGGWVERGAHRWFRRRLVDACSLSRHSCLHLSALAVLEPDLPGFRSEIGSVYADASSGLRDLGLPDLLSRPVENLSGWGREALLMASLPRVGSSTYALPNLYCPRGCGDHATPLRVVRGGLFYPVVHSQIVRGRVRTRRLFPRRVSPGELVLVNSDGQEHVCDELLDGDASSRTGHDVFVHSVCSVRFYTTPGGRLAWLICWAGMGVSLIQQPGGPRRTRGRGRPRSLKRLVYDPRSDRPSGLGDIVGSGPRVSSTPSLWARAARESLAIFVASHGHATATEQSLDSVSPPVSLRAVLRSVNNARARKSQRRRRERELLKRSSFEMVDTGLGLKPVFDIREGRVEKVPVKPLPGGRLNLPQRSVNRCHGRGMRHTVKADRRVINKVKDPKPANAFVPKFSRRQTDRVHKLRAHWSPAEARYPRKSRIPLFRTGNWADSQRSVVDHGSRRSSFFHSTHSGLRWRTRGDVAVPASTPPTRLLPLESLRRDYVDYVAERLTVSPTHSVQPSQLGRSTWNGSVVSYSPERRGSQPISQGGSDHQPTPYGDG